MKALVHSIDSHHYEHLHEKSCSKKNKPNKDKSDKKPGNQNSSNNSGDRTWICIGMDIAIFDLLFSQFQAFCTL